MTALAVVSASQCPACLARLDNHLFDQPALFLHGGYGATERTVYRSCPVCGWSLTSEVGAVRPDQSPDDAHGRTSTGDPRARPPRARG